MGVSGNSDAQISVLSSQMHSQVFELSVGNLVPAQSTASSRGQMQPQTLMLNSGASGGQQVSFLMHSHSQVSSLKSGRDSSKAQMLTSGQTHAHWCQSHSLAGAHSSYSHETDMDEMEPCRWKLRSSN